MYYRSANLSFQWNACVWVRRKLGMPFDPVTTSSDDFIDPWAAPISRARSLWCTVVDVECRVTIAAAVEGTTVLNPAWEYVARIAGPSLSPETCDGYVHSRIIYIYNIYKIYIYIYNTYFHTKSDTKSDDVGYRVWYRIWYMKLFGCYKSIQELVQLIYRRFRRDEGQLTNCTVAWRNLPPNHCGWSRFLELLKLAYLRTQPRSLQLHCSSLNRISQGKEIKESVAKRVIVIRRGRFSWHHVPSCHAHSWCLHVLLCFEWPGWKEIDVLCFSLFHRRWLNSYSRQGNRLHDRNYMKLHEITMMRKGLEVRWQLWPHE